MDNNFVPWATFAAAVLGLWGSDGSEQA